MKRSKSDDFKIESVKKKVRQIELVGYGLKNTRVINRTVSLPRVAFLEQDDVETETRPQKRRR